LKVLAAIRSNDKLSMATAVAVTGKTVIHPPLGGSVRLHLGLLGLPAVLMPELATQFPDIAFGL
jgi:hypothetical protein